MGLKHDIQTPVGLLLSSQEPPLELEQILRVLPGKRVVVKAVVAKAVAKAHQQEAGENKTVLAKIFFQKKNYDHEISSYQALKASAVKTPELQAYRKLGTGGICYYEFLPGIVSLGDAWEGASAAEKKQWTEDLLDLVKQLYEAGLAQEDCHPGNFVFCGQQLFLLDPAGCVQTTEEEFFYRHLAELPSQFPLKDQGQMTEAIYRRFAVSDKMRFEASVRRAWELRKKNYLKKTFRANSATVDLGGPGRLLLCHRQWATEEFLHLLQDPDGAIAGGEILKDGRNSTVAKVICGGEAVVIKRYHNKNTREALRKLFSKNRARNNWYFAHLLSMVGIVTPEPLALLKTSRGPLHYSWYYISRHVAADNAYNVFSQTPPTARQLQQLKDIFDGLQAAGIEHGDCKSTNWLVNADNIWLVDLDAMTEIGCYSGRHPDRDRQRFLRDWQNHPAVLGQFRAALGVDAL